MRERLFDAALLFQDKSRVKSELKITNSNMKICGAQLDCVASRLQAAERARREDYENEVLNSPPPRKQPPVSTYRLACERQCMRATDGHDYTVTKISKNDNRCDSSRTPPRPSPVELEANTGCQIKQDSYLEPCSHQPRIFIEIDRPTLRTTSSKTEMNKDNKCENDLRGQQTKSKRSSSETNISGKSDNKWCSNLPTPKPVPPTCKEPSLIERLRRRSGGTSSNTCSRQLHTYNSACGPMLLPSVSLKQKPKDKTTLTSQEEPQLAEAARGRFVTGRLSFDEGKQQHLSGGGLDLKIPPTTEAVRVQVSFDFNTTRPISCTDNQLLSPTNNAFSNSKSTSDSWLSIKSLQKKLKGYKNTESKKESKDTEKRTACENPNINQNKHNPCAPRLHNNTSTKHNNFSHPQAHLIAFT